MNEQLEQHALEELVRDHLVRRNRVVLDWREYYYKFSAVHGGFPVIYNNLQLFRTGWRYSATDYAGPEWPAPTDAAGLLRLKRIYWRLHRQQIEREYRFYTEHRNMLKDWQQTKSAPLQQSFVDLNEETGTVSYSSGEVDWQRLDTIIDICKAQLIECDKEQTALEEVTCARQTLS